MPLKAIATSGPSVPTDFPKKIKKCPRGHELRLEYHDPGKQNTSICKPSSRSYHKWSKEGTPFMTCSCDYKVCIACAEVGQYEEHGGAGLTKTLVLMRKEGIKELLTDEAIKFMGLASEVQALGALSSIHNFYALAHAGGKSVALWRTCCNWRDLHAQLEKLDDVRLRALCVVEASKNDTGRQLSELIRHSLVERRGKLTTPPPEVFVERLADAAAQIHLQNASDYSKASTGLFCSAASAALCTIA